MTIMCHSSANDLVLPRNILTFYVNGIYNTLSLLNRGGRVMMDGGQVHDYPSG
jgi:hypothetical protein